MSSSCQLLDFKNRKMQRELVETRVKIIQSKLNDGQVIAAQFELEPLLRKFPENTDLLTLSGFVDIALGNGKRALASLKKVYEMQQDAGSALNLSSAYISARLYPPALKAVQRGMQHHEEKPYPYFGRLWHNRGYIYEHMGRYQQALKDYEQALYHTPGYIPTLKQIAALHEKMGHGGAALRYYRRYAYACQTCFFPMSKLVQHLRLAGDYEIAHKVVENYLKNSYITPADKNKAQSLLASTLKPRRSQPTAGKKSFPQDKLPKPE